MIVQLLFLNFDSSEFKKSNRSHFLKNFWLVISYQFEQLYLINQIADDLL